MSKVILLKTRTSYRVLDFVNQQKGFTEDTPKEALESYYRVSGSHLSVSSVSEFVKHYYIPRTSEYEVTEEIELDPSWSSVEEVCKTYPELFV